jgi:hypothetical protein
MDTVLLDNFLASVVAQAAKSLELTDRTTEEIVSEDEMLLSAARYAYAQVASYTGRQFVNDTYTELYTDEEVRIKLRNTPVTSTPIVYDEEGTQLVLDTDYKVFKNYVIMDVDVSPYEYFITSNAEEDHYNVMIVYSGGYESAQEDPILESALAMQTVANYNRRAHLGVALITAESAGFRGGAIRIAPEMLGVDSSLVHEAREILSPYVYYGSAVDVNV